jgi:hypothetical protein
MLCYFTGRRISGHDESSGDSVSHRSLSVLILAAALAFAGGAAARAQNAAPPPPPKPVSTSGTVQAVAYAPLPAGAHFETQSNDNTELDQETMDLVNKQLADRGYVLDEQGGYVMVVETDLVRGQKQDDPLGQAFANNKEAGIQGRLFSTSQNSLLHPEQPIGSADRLYRISISVYDRASGLYVWRASTTRDNPDLDVTKATREMVPELLSQLGRTVQPPAQ